MSIKIAFYGEMRKTGTTANMLSLAWMTALQKPEQTVLAEREEKRYLLWKGISKEQILFLDCGDGKTKKARRYWKEADMKVLNVAPEGQSLERYVLYGMPGEECPFFLVGNYHGETMGAKAYLRNFYRIEEENVGWIPYNNEFAYAFGQGKMAQFIQKYYRGELTEQNRSFFEEMERSFFLLQKRMERNVLEYRR